MAERSADDGEARRTSGVAGGLEGLGHEAEQVSDEVGYGGVVLGGQRTGLAVEVAGDGYGDVFSGDAGFSHGTSIGKSKVAHEGE